MKKITCCPLCDAGKFSPFYEGIDKYYSQKHVRLDVCDNCGLIFLNPRFTDEEYKEWYASVFQNKRRGMESVKQAVIGIKQKNKYKQKQKELKYFLGYVNKDSKCLEIGAGWGVLAKAVKDKFGCEVDVVEPSELAARVAREHFKLNVFNGDFESFINEKKDGAKYDFIYSYHVFEHITEPGAFLEKIKGVLSPAGVLLLALPDTLKPDRPEEEYFHIDHCFYYTPRTIELMLNRHGFEIKKIWRCKNDMKIVCSPAAIGYALKKDSNEIQRAQKALKRINKKYKLARGLKKILFVFFTEKQRDKLNRLIYS